MVTALRGAVLVAVSRALAWRVDLVVGGWRGGPARKTSSALAERLPGSALKTARSSPLSAESPMTS